MKKSTIKLIAGILIFAIAFTTFALTVGAQEVDLSEDGADTDAAATAASVTISADQVVSYFRGRVNEDYENNYCLRFVADAWASFGATRSSACCAYNYGSSHIQSTSINDVPVGADVFFGQASSTCSKCHSNAGHVGVYIGNGQFVHATGGKVKCGNLSDWAGRFRGWGYHSYITISNSPDPTPTPTPVENHDPIAHLDGVEEGKACVTIWGWSFDPDTSNPNMVHAYLKAPAGDPNAEFLGGFYANMIDRPDVCQAYPQCQGSLHGFHAQLSVSAASCGTYQLYLYAINVDGSAGNNNCFAETTVTIQQPDSTPPAFKSCKIASYERTTYRLAAVPADDSQVDKMKAAVWTLNNDMSDLKWVDMVRLSDGTYIYDVQRSDFSDRKNSVYINDVYLYYKNGQETGTRLIRDYRVQDKSPKLFQYGEYRIISALDTQVGIDISGASVESGANVQLYKNTADKKQTFTLTYTDDGYYIIENTNSNKVLDVLYDTYLPNTTVSQHDENGGDNQKWLIYAADNNRFRIQSRSNELLLSAADGKAENKTDVRVETNKGTNAQRWYIKRVLKDQMVEAKDISYVSGEPMPGADVTVTVDGKVLTENTDYTVESSINGNKGTVTVTGIGDYYCDSVTKEFNITENEPATVPSTEEPTEKPTIPSTEPPVDTLTIVSQPVDWTGVDGETAAFTVVAEGTGLSYQWYYRAAGKTKWTAASGTGATYSIVMNASRAGRQYYCKVTDSANNSIDSAVVSMNYPPTAIITQPEDWAGFDGETASFTVEAQGKGLSYRWFYRPAGRVKWTETSVTDATYSTVMNANRAGREYYCKVTDSAQTSVDSAVVKLDYPVYSAPIIRVQPTDWTGRAGQMTDISVTAMAPADYELSYQWYYRAAGASKWTKASDTDNVYDITMTKTRSGRELYCRVTDNKGNFTNSSVVTMTLDPSTGPVITAQPESWVGPNGAQASFTVEAEGDGLTYQWFYRPAGKTKWTATSAAEATYSITMTSTRSGREYYCKITDSANNSVDSDIVMMTIGEVPQDQLR